MLTSFITFVETQFHTIVKIIRSDNVQEFCDHTANQFYSSKGIIHQTSCRETPQQNGKVERKHKHLLEIARSLHFQAKLPIKYWGNHFLLPHIFSIECLSKTFNTNPHMRLFITKNHPMTISGPMVVYVLPLLSKLIGINFSQGLMHVFSLVIHMGKRHINF